MVGGRLCEGGTSSLQASSCPPPADCPLSVSAFSDFALCGRGLATSWTLCLCAQSGLRRIAVCRLHLSVGARAPARFFHGLRLELVSVGPLAMPSDLSHWRPPVLTPLFGTGSPGPDTLDDPSEEVSSRSVAEVALQISDPPWFRVTIHLPGLSHQRVSPSALFTQAPTAISLVELTRLASEHVVLFRSHSAL